MADVASKLRKDTLDKDLEKIADVEDAASITARRIVAPGLAILFLAAVAAVASFIVAGQAGAIVIVAAAAIGGYMALNIGANDVANNVGPAVGAKALTLGGALVIAAIFEGAGALIAGGDVVETISKGIIAPEAVGDPEIFVRVMMAALLSSAIWVHLATWLGAPVSTTHAIVGGVVGAGVASSGIATVDWSIIAGITVSWVVSPILGAIIAAMFLAFIKAAIIYRDDKIAAARRWVPVLVAIMAGAFAAYLVSKGLNKVVETGPLETALVGFAAFALAWLWSSRHVARQSEGMENRNQSLRKLFTIPLVASAALLSFAHGANDVANAVGPLAAIVSTVLVHDVETQVVIPLWVMLIGAGGISLGLMLFGPRLIRMVGEQITKLNPMRAFCVALSAAVTVIVASALGLPVSSTHIAVGAVFGVGFYREWYTANSKRRRAYMARKAAIYRASLKNGNGKMAPDEDLDEEEPTASLSREEIARRKLVRRAHVRTIVAAWVTTVPAAAVLAAMIFQALRAIA
jgi:PiT family inorganic phosphate transporter